MHLLRVYCKKVSSPSPFGRSQSQYTIHYFLRGYHARDLISSNLCLMCRVYAALFSYWRIPHGQGATGHCHSILFVEVESSCPPSRKYVYGAVASRCPSLPSGASVHEFSTAICSFVDTYELGRGEIPQTSLTTRGGEVWKLGLAV